MTEFDQGGVLALNEALDASRQSAVADFGATR